MNKASKKERKREQNKTAALRYRQKKKGEKGDIEVRRTELEEANKKLKAQLASIENEINYLKKLSREVNKRIQNKQSLS
jgi:chromosome segregation ATPase